MAFHCNINDETAMVVWSWDNNRSFKRYLSKLTPIQVDITPTTIEGIGSTGMWTMITSDTVTSNNSFSYSGDSFDSPIFNNRTITSAKDGRVLYSDTSFNAGAIQATNIQFTPSPQSGYKIVISDFSGNQLYEDKKAGNSPPTYTVDCGENCPEGSHKCTHNKYPGYCCVPCKEVGEKLKNIANKIR